MKNKILLIVLLVALGVGYIVFRMSAKPASDRDLNSRGTTTPGTSLPSGSFNEDLPIEPAALVVRKDLAAKIGADEKEIIILEIKDETWSNGCLGLEQPGEMCTMALVPGFHIILVIDGNEYAYRTNKDGTVFRLESGPTKTGEVIIR